MIRFANQLGITPRIGAYRHYSPAPKYSTIWLEGGGNNLVWISKSQVSINRFLSGLISNLAHELAHWLVASPQQRKCKNYGIPSTRSKRSSKVNIIWDTNEAKVFYMDHYLRKRLGVATYRDPLRLSFRFSDMKEYRQEAKTWWKNTGSKILSELKF